MKYAMGTDWFEQPGLIGPTTQYFKSVQLMKLYVSGDQIEGKSVRLIVQADGNLSTSPIRRQDF